ncbi:LacI family DNA-binding transcriptional regulator [Cohnella thailandensis]|uniref:LacI family DNA-binding transcriptional regulator n=1 Tax=Cohnella thailandensis TaxID=557557 RepID=A0A841SYC9_9BACL|nr:LacI family DNA-binding transcriptional regulator [Cohnella thailandensis]MBB6636914.1 LacI family DNA-binding transcriptional regulator [Cohnella thailandensis]MBP1973205.1 LacI family transcriptional regulator [Cohnella thailandensis]
MDKHTIYHIAERVGVSPSTVSRALSGRGYCGEKTKEKILKAAQEMNYAPDSAAKTLKMRRTRKIIFAVPDICNPFYFDMINGINQVLEEYGYLMILIYTKHSLAEELKAIQNLREKVADGMIMVSFNFCEENIRAINALKAPVVLTNQYVSPAGQDRFDYVYVDTYAGIRLATEHLIGQGIGSIAYVGGSLGEQTGYQRFCGYREAMRDGGLPMDDRYVAESDYTERGGYLAARKWLERRDRPEGIVAANDLMAIGVMKACEEAGLRIPEDVAIVGMDNLDIASRVYPKLTSVALLQEEIGRQAATLLMRRLEGHPVANGGVKLVPRLVVRDSSVRPVRE